MLHAVLDELGQLLPLGAPVQVEALLADALGAAGRLGALAAQPARPLHALLAQQWVLRLVAARGVAVRRLVLPRLAPVAGVLALLQSHRHLGLRIGDRDRGAL